MFTLHCSSELSYRTFYYVFTFLRCGLPWYTFKGTPYERRQVRTVSGFLHFQIDFQRIFTLTNINLNMVFHRIQYENMSKEEFIQELTISTQDLSMISVRNNLSEKLNEFLSKYDKVPSEFQQCKKFNSHLLTRIIQLERNTVTNAQYSRGEKKINFLPESQFSKYNAKN